MLFEFNDQSWLPASIRREMTLYLDFLSRFMGRYLPVSEIVAQVVEREDLDSLVDLCSGASSTAIVLREKVEERTGRELTVYMTDKHPVDADCRHPDAGVVWDRRSVDACSVPADLVGIRTLFTSFHHFRGGAAKEVLRDSINRGQPIAIFEHADRGWWVMAKLVLTTPLLVWMSLAARERLAPSAVIFNVVCPVVPLMLAWDGVTSVRRTYSLDEMRTIVESTCDGEFDWWIGRTDPVGKRGIGPVYYLVGAPSSAGDGFVQIQRGGFPAIVAGRVA